MTGAWITRKSPSTAVVLITDSRPLLTRSVRCRPISCQFILANFMLDALRGFGFFVHDLRWPDPSPYFWFVLTRVFPSNF